MNSSPSTNHHENQPQPETAPRAMGGASETVALATEATMVAVAGLGSDLKEKGPPWAQIAGDKMAEVRDAVSAKSGELYGQAREHAVDWRDGATAAIRENPVRFVLGALAAGLIVGFGVRRMR